ncbi:MAG: PLP-dependent aminotransferase family protein [Halobacteriota archaeon]|nr:PLP-dependent aminotransferase family protein [Halobacteriota archaeon]
MKDVHNSFTREILKIASDPKIISFAGGLPNPKLFPVKEIAEASVKVLNEDGEDVLQYNTTEGYLPLRRYIAERYLKKDGLNASPEEILITSGSQQGLDLASKTFLNEGDGVILESPSYLGAIQAFSLYRPSFQTVPLLEGGIDVDTLKRIIPNSEYKFLYTVPNFQNPSGISYSKEKRIEVAEILKDQNTILIEDDPYSKIRFSGRAMPPIKKYLGGRSIMLGTFSKTMSPSFRIGWIYAPDWMIEKLNIAKQASDLHSSYFSQRVIFQFLSDNDLDCHISRLREVYKRQRDCMIDAIEEHFPDGVRFTKPEGGMFIWVKLPNGSSSMKLFDAAIKNDVAFVPGVAFYAGEVENETFRLNFSNTSEEEIKEGIKRLGCIIKDLN